MSEPTPPAASKSARKRESTMACEIRARSRIVAISAGRSIGLVVTATPPALSTPSQEANSIALLGPRRKTRFPGIRPSRSTSRRAGRAGGGRVLPRVRGPGLVDEGERGRILRVEHLARVLEQLAILKLR